METGTARAITGVTRERVPVAAYVALAFGVFCISWAALFVRWAQVPGLTSAFYRLLIAGAVLFPLWLQRRPQHLPRPALRTALLAGALFGLDFALWNSSLLLTTAAKATLLANFAPIWVGLGGWLFFKDKLGGRFWAGMAIAVLGVTFVLGGQAIGDFAIEAGDPLALGASIFYGGYILLAARARTSLDALSVVTLSVLSGAVVLFGLALVFQTPLTVPAPSAWAALLGLGLISHAGGVLAINYALGHITAGATSVSLLAQPVLTALLAVPLLGEPLAALQIAGGLIVLAGILLVQKAGTRT